MRNVLIFACSRLAIVRDMTAAGLGLNRFCYAGLIAAHKNKTPVTDDLGSKVKYNACSCDYDLFAPFDDFLLFLFPGKDH